MRKAREVACERCRIAAYVGDGSRRLCAKLVHHVCSKAGTRGIDHYDVRLLVGKLAICVSAYGFDVVEARGIEVASEVAYGRTVRLDCRHPAALVCEW